MSSQLFSFFLLIEREMIWAPTYLATRIDGGDATRPSLTAGVERERR